MLAISLAPWKKLGRKCSGFVRQAFSGFGIIDAVYKPTSLVRNKLLAFISAQVSRTIGALIMIEDLRTRKRPWRKHFRVRSLAPPNFTRALMNAANGT